MCATFGAQYVVVVFAVATGDLALAKETPGTAFKHVIHLDVVPYVAGVIRALATAHGHAAVWGYISENPRNFIHAMDGLLHQSITTAPSEIIPVAHLPLDVAPLWVAAVIRRHGFHRAGVVGGVHALHIANGTIGNALEKFASAGLVPPAKACHHRQAFFLGKLVAFHDRPQARGIRGHGFLEENMFTGFDCGLEV